MRRRRGMILVIFSLCMGGVAAWAANDWVNDRLNTPADLAGTEPVVVAVMDIPYGTKVEGRHVKLVRLPIDSIPADSHKDLASVEGMVAKTNLQRGETILASRLAEHAAGSTLAALVTQNMRAVTVRVDDVVGVAGFLLPGNRVDILSSRMTSGRARTETILKNIKVLAVDQTAATQENDPVIVRAVTLEMTPTQSEELVRAKSEGSIQLTLRNPLEEQVVAKKPEPITVKKAPRISVPKRTVRRNDDTLVTIIRGTHVDRQKTKS
ncbi:MAG: Flp pilus assembly protein CpaB [Pseudomonadales bacterium]|nr:Flp pilus assembly protein CpaB [Pseudomonadales bacterium]